jgi:hypothetical protein
MPDTNPWSALKDDVLGTLKEAVGDLVDVESAAVKAPLAAIAEDMARQTWLSVEGTGDEKLQAASNLRSLRAQATIVAAIAVVTGAAELRAAFVKAIETAGIFLLQNAPKLLAAI